VQPTLTVVKGRVLTLVQGGRRERSGSLLRSGRAGVFAREPRHQAAGVRFSASLLVTFLWRSREKLLARRGEFPARCTELQRLPAKATRTPLAQRRELPARCTECQRLSARANPWPPQPERPNDR
jgi:hypothetical protein